MTQVMIFVTIPDDFGEPPLDLLAAAAVEATCMKLGLESGDVEATIGVVEPAEVTLERMRQEVEGDAGQG